MVLKTENKNKSEIKKIWQIDFTQVRLLNKGKEYHSRLSFQIL